MILDDLAAASRARVARKKKELPLEEVRIRAEKLAAGEGRFTFPFEKAIAKKDVPHLDIALDYESAGADCISVLTEPDYFKGDDRFLKEISNTVSLPTLRKDFTVDPYLIYEAKLLGASCVLLIAALLDTDAIRQYKAVCDGLGLSALVEAHDERELYSALDAGARLVGVNNRDLRTFTVDIQNSIRLRKLVPENILFVAESGIQDAGDIQALRDAGVDGVLIGETLMRSSDKADMIRKLKGI